MRALAVLLLLSLAACAETGETRADYAAADTQGHVRAVTLVAAPAGVPPGFEAAFAARALARLKACAHGKRPLTLQNHPAPASRFWNIG